MTKFQILGIGAGIVILGLGLAAVLGRGPALSGQMQTIVQNEPLQVEIEIEESEAKVGSPSHIHVLVNDNTGQPFDVYGNEYMLHLVVASEDFGDLAHIYSGFVSDEIGVYGVDYTFVSPGRHRAWIEVDNTTSVRHGENSAYVGYKDFHVAATQAGNDFSGILEQGHEAQTGPYRIRLDYGELQAGKPASLKLSVKDSKNQPVKLLDPEPVLYAMTGPGLDFFRHTHSNPTTDGQNVVVTDTFPKAGEYAMTIDVFLIDEQQNVVTLRASFLLTVND